MDTLLVLIGPDSITGRLEASLDARRSVGVARYATGLHFLRDPPERVERVLAVAEPGSLSGAVVGWCDRERVALVAVADSARQRRLAASFGLDPVREEAAWSRLAESGAAMPRAVPHAGGPARLIVCASAAGAPGRTSLAIGTAAELAAVGRRVVLVDADRHAPSVAQHLALPMPRPGHTQVRYRSSAGDFDVVTADRDGVGRIEDQDGTGASIASLRSAADDVVVDLGPGPGLAPADTALLAAADAVLVVGTADPVGLARLLRAWPFVLSAAPAGSVHAVVNRVRARVTGPDAAVEIRRALQRFADLRPSGLIPEDGRTADLALVRGLTWIDAAPRSAGRLAVRRLVLRVCPGVAIPGHTRTVGAARRGG